MKKTMYASAGLFLAIFLFNACRKDNSTIKNTPFKTVKIGNSLAIWAKHAPATQSFTLDASTSTWITGAKGCRFYFPANSLLDAANNPVSGTVNIELREYLSKSDMLFSGVTVTSGSQLLETGGMFYLMARKNGAALQMKNNAGFFMIIPQSGNSIDPMTFWKGELSGDSLNKVDWAQQDSVPIKPVQDTFAGAREVYFKQFDYFQFGYCNIDREFQKFKTLITKFRVKMPDGCNDTNSTALLMFKNYNSCAWCFWNTTENLLSTGYSLPLGETAKVIAYKKTGPGEDDLEYVVQEFTFSDNTLVTIGGMSKCTFAQLTALIKAL